MKKVLPPCTQCNCAALILKGWFFFIDVRRHVRVSTAYKWCWPSIELRRWRHAKKERFTANVLNTSCKHGEWVLATVNGLPLIVTFVCLQLTWWWHCLQRVCEQFPILKPEWVHEYAQKQSQKLFKTASVRVLQQTPPPPMPFEAKLYPPSLSRWNQLTASFQSEFCPRRIECHLV